MRLISKYLLCLLLAGAALVVVGWSPACAEWTEHSDPLVPAIPDDPAWEKYAFDLPFVSGEGKLTFHELARSGEPFVLYWWLTDCPMCHLQMPYVQQLYNQSQDGKLGIRVVSICIDSDKRDCLPYIEDKKLKFEVLFDGRARRTDEKFQVGELGTPLAYVFDAGGVPVGKLSGFTSTFAKDVLELLKIDAPQTADSADSASAG